MLKHLAIIPDGNRRYARKKRMPSWIGHKAGIDTLEKITLSAFEDFNIYALTIYAFSTYNFARPTTEIKHLMRMFVDVFTRLSKDKRIHKNQVRIKAVGKISKLPKNVREAIRKAEKATAHHKKHHLTFAMAYDGRTEIVDAVRKLVKQKKKISEKTIEGALYLNNIEPPELIIRTSGENRLSGFLLWNSSYAEFFFSKKLWPEFTKKDLSLALNDYKNRQRRFGN